MGGVETLRLRKVRPGAGRHVEREKYSFVRIRLGRALLRGVDGNLNPFDRQPAFVLFPQGNLQGPATSFEADGF